MPRLDPNLILHHLNISPEVKLVKQKIKKMYPHIALLVKAELKKLINTNFIHIVFHKNMHHIMKDGGHGPLIGGPNIF